MTTLVLATTNAGKMREIREVLDGLDIEIRALTDFPLIVEPEETGRTFEENARAKALYYAATIGALAVAEDSGLEIDALDRAPGVYSARFGGERAPTYPEKFALIYRMLDERGAPESTARFACVLALARPGEVLFEARGTIEGRITSPPRGSGGFGYDPIFFYPPFGCTLAEVPTERKSAVSHRGQAFRKLRAFLERQILL